MHYMCRRHLLRSASELGLRHRIFSLHYAVGLVRRRLALQCRRDHNGGSDMHTLRRRDLLGIADDVNLRNPAGNSLSFVRRRLHLVLARRDRLRLLGGS